MVRSRNTCLRSLTIWNCRVSHSHTGPYDFWIVRLFAIWPRCDRSAMSATISSSGRLGVRLVVRSPTIGEDRWQDHPQVIVRLIVAITDRSYGQSLRPTNDRTINRDVVCQIVRSIVASGDRSHDEYWHPATDHTIDHGVLRPIVRPIVASGDGSHHQSWHCTRSYDWSFHRSQSRATNEDLSRVVALPNVMSYDGWHLHSSCGMISCTTNRAQCVIRDHPQPVVRPRTADGTIA